MTYTSPLIVLIPLKASIDIHSHGIRPLCKKTTFLKAIQTNLQFNYLRLLQIIYFFSFFFYYKDYKHSFYNIGTRDYNSY